MSWFTKVCFFFTAVAMCIPALAQTINLSGDGRLATLTSRVLPSNEAMPPVEFELAIPTAELDPAEDGFHALSIGGLDPLAIAGNPEVMTTGKLIAVPEGYSPSLEIVSSDAKVIPGVLLKPFQRKFRCSGTNAVGFAFNHKLYESRGMYPQEPVVLEEMGQMQDLRLVRVAFYPVQENFSNQSISITHRATVRVSFVSNGRNARPTTMSRTMYQIVRNTVSNAEGLRNSVVANADAEKMLIVTADALESSIQPLVAWKQSKGLKVDVVNFTTVGGTKEKTLAFVKNYYETQAVKPTYLLLVGNKTSMPGFFESTGSGNAASDLRFSLLAGSDNIPDLLYGRLLADSAMDVDTQVKRWVAYEKAPDQGTWYPQATTIASDEGSGPSDEEYAIQIKDALSAKTYTLVDTFQQGAQTATFKNISSAIDEGRTWLAYFGHGSGTGWGSTNDSFNVSSIGKLQNGNKLPVVIDVACANASWVSISKCFGKAWVTHETTNGDPAGAVGYYGGSVNISWHEPAVMSVGISKYHFEKPVYSLGGSVVAGQLYMFEKMGTGSNTVDNLKWYNLFGDPSLVMRTANPRDFQVKHHVYRGARGVTVSVEAVDATGAALEGLLTSVSVDGKAHIAVGTTDKSGKAELSLPGISVLEPNTQLTVTGYNHKTVQTSLN